MAGAATRIDLFDAHLHVIDPRFPLVAGSGFLPAPFTCGQYRARTAPFALLGGAVVSASFQGADQEYLRAALAELGPGFVGVTQLSGSVSDETVLALDRAGVRALRFNLRRGGSAEVDCLAGLARRVHALAGWHVEIYADAAELTRIAGVIANLPAVVVDHLGLEAAALPLLRELVCAGVRVKASGFGRLDYDPRIALETLAACDPQALVFGTDLPSTRAPRPFQDEDVSLVLDTLGAELGARVLCENALDLYRIAPARSPPAHA